MKPLRKIKMGHHELTIQDLDILEIICKNERALRYYLLGILFD